MRKINRTRLKNLLVPVVQKSKQEEIAELVKQSFALQKEAKQLLEQAKSKVENFIER